MAARDRHHALATPADVNTWCEDLLEGRSAKTVYREYWVRVEHFYSWLQSHTDYPHVYHPPLMAVVECDASRRIWDAKLSGKAEARKYD
ncbi:hypothetical protein [Halomarina ordinaria]|uniref:Core-binding (CB) domain-containing protein n=1 Tax=Halomarina ordinaria TaxID=3033939 RepID=A0ABD5UFJ0_9EURY|nr:hypothetical protein [Halomarina sp. PSRA2]